MDSDDDLLPIDSDDARGATSLNSSYNGPEFGASPQRVSIKHPVTPQTTPHKKASRSLSTFREMRRRKSMIKLSHSESLTLSPLQKFRHFGRFPFKLMLHIAVVIFSTAYVALFNTEYSAFLDATERSFRNILFQLDVDDPTQNTGLLYTVSDVLAHQKSVYTDYTQFHNSSVGETEIDTKVELLLQPLNGSDPSTTFVYPSNPLGQYQKKTKHYPTGIHLTEEPNGLPPVMGAALHLCSLKSVSSYPLPFMLTCALQFNDLTAFSIGPFNQPTIANEREFFDGLMTATFVYSFNNSHYSTLWSNGKYVHTKFMWTCKATYDFSVDIETKYYLQFQSKPETTEILSPGLMLIDGMTLLCSLLSMMLVGKALGKSHKAYRYARRRLMLPRAERGDPNNKSMVVWADVTWADKMAFFNLWLVVTAFANVCFVVACSIGIVRLYKREPSERGTISLEQVFRAMGLFSAWVSLIRFFEYESRFYVLIIAMRASLTHVARFILVVFPLYMGYALIGVFSFSEQDDFNNLWRALRTLFALLNGDSILLLYQEVCPSDRSEGVGYCLWGQLYLYTFCVLFITTVLNIFIFIIEAGFDRANSAIRNEQASDETMKLDHDRLKDILDAADAVHGINLDVFEHDEPDDAFDLPPKGLPRKRMSVVSTASSSPLAKGSARDRSQQSQKHSDGRHRHAGHDQSAVGGDGISSSNSGDGGGSSGSGVKSTILDNDAELLSAIHNAVHRALEAHTQRLAEAASGSGDGGGSTAVSAGGTDVQRFRRETETAVANMQRAQVAAQKAEQELAVAKAEAAALRAESVELRASVLAAKAAASSPKGAAPSQPKGDRYDEDLQDDE